MNPETLIQSQQVTLTGPHDEVARVLKLIRSATLFHDITVTLTPTSVPDAQGSVTDCLTKNSRHRWTKDVPVEQGDYWHWGGNPDCAPFILQIMWSGTAKKCFVSIRDVPGAPFCDEYGGWWMRIQKPQTPDPDATVGVTRDSQQKSRQDGEV